MTDGIVLDLSRASNVDVLVDETRTRLIPLQTRDPVSHHILTAPGALETSVDLAAVLATAPTSNSDVALWVDAIGLGALESTPHGRASIARLMEAALIRMGVAADHVPLDNLSQEDVRAMRDTVGFPDRSDLAVHLLNRGPSLRDSFETGEQYEVTRFEFGGWHYVHERMNSRDYLGIPAKPGLNLADWLITPFRPEEDPVAVVRGEEARSRRFFLTPLPRIVLAAKAFRAAERAPEEHRVYPLLLAAQAIDRARDPATGRLSSTGVRGGS